MDVELARQQWNDGNRRIERIRGAGEPYRLLSRQVELVQSALRARVGQVFTLQELADAYDGSDVWVRPLLDDARPEDAPPPDAATAADAAFHHYARGASDYAP